MPLTFTSTSVLVAAVTVLRLVLAQRLPITGDEAYYWVWSRHPAFSYIDEPPMVAWLVALGGVLGKQTLFIRLPFVLCYSAAALTAGSAARALARDERAFAWAALLVVFLPQSGFTFGEISPDGPFVLAWALALAAAARVVRGGVAWPVVLGIAVAVALLSRTLGWALAFGMVCYAASYGRNAGIRAWGIAAAVAGVLYAPFLIADAAAHWQNFTFSFAHRHDVALLGSAARPWSFYDLRSLLYGLAIVGIALALLRRARYALPACTLVPLAALLTGLSLVENVLPHWYFGAVISLAVALGMALPGLSAFARRGAAGIVVTAGCIVFAGNALLAAPQGAQVRVRALGLGGVFLPDVGASDGELAAALARAAGERGARVVTADYALAGVLQYDGLDTLLVGAPGAFAGGELRRARPDVAPPRALYVTLDERDPHCAGAYARVESGPTYRYSYGGAPLPAYYTRWCSDPRRDAARVLFGS